MPNSSNVPSAGPDDPKHIWYFDKDDDVPMGQPGSSEPTSMATNNVQPEGRGHRKKADSRMQESIQAEIAETAREAAEKSLRIKIPSRVPRQRASAPHAGGTASEEDDGSFVESSGESSEDDEHEAVVDNAELAESLPSKTIPLAQKKKSRQRRKNDPKRKRSKSPAKGVIKDASTSKKPRCQSLTIEEVEGTDTAPSSQARKSSSARPSESNATVSTKPKKSSARRTNPIYLFYEQVETGADGKTADGDTHYKCCHGSRKTLTVTKAMKYSLNGLVGHLKNHFPAMYRLYEVLKARSEPPTAEELDIVTGRTKLDTSAAGAYVSKLERASSNIMEALQRQAARATLLAQKNLKGEFVQDDFENLLAEWIVACDQPFDEVDKQPFRKLLVYTHRPSAKPLRIPHRTSIRARIMKMGEDTVGNVKKMFSELESKVSISLDAWTSSNQYAFLAIVAHYITNDGRLEELLIDFRELVGAHSGENMGEAVWKTLEMYGLFGRVIAFVMDNASNNDTLLDSIEARCEAVGIKFSAKQARLRCMPHTCHLAALKLLESIGAISKSDSRKAAGRSGNYQDAVTAPVSREHDDAGVVDEEEVTDGALPGVSPSINKLRKIVRAVRSSPQRRRAWLKDVAIHQSLQATDSSDALMLILDVRTRWSSTHQMLRVSESSYLWSLILQSNTGRALDYREVIDTYVARNRDLHNYQLSEEDWDGITLVARWLKSFRSATTQMSVTHHPTLSTTHAIFRGLQEQIKDILIELPPTTPPELVLGLTDTHRKLSDYYYKFDESPLYTWAALLDPRISYEGMKADYANDDNLSEYLDSAKASLHTYFYENYAGKHVAPPVLDHPRTAGPSKSKTSSQSRNESPQKVNFTARYRKQSSTRRDQLDEYFALPREDFDTCDPISWWVGRRSQFPDLFVFARDLLAIPGSAVSVERIFSGGRDTISLRRASLRPDTIRTLMLVKQHLRITQRAIDDLIGNESP
ncbi:hypothetical protein M378DRAFT_201131 [Amanita muscaria Koide BX008]|uniref:HAT C-terminal dimerisation domain-containing protein n=1 Tax=Amanita muscaria (strain Koide BX008) TaxID=946122 RepID=A0A0C2WG14_AMAMK|nr:hypothetical protein M378DRAFT_201131 [Amanita muscaria Koide BX008]